MHIDDFFRFSQSISDALLSAQTAEVIRGYRSCHHFDVAKDGVFVPLLKLTERLEVILA
jgi:hypothetical protein